MTAYDKLRELLYSDSFALEVLPRRRLFVSGVSTSVPAAQVDATAIFSLVPNITFNGPGDGVLFEWAELIFTPASTSSVVCTDASITANVFPTSGSRSVGFGLRRSRFTPAATSFSTLTAAEQFDTSPGLFSALDLAGANGRNVAVNQITNLTFDATFFESGGLAQSITWQATLFLRQVRGLQEN